VNEETDPHCLSAEEADKLLAGAPWERFAVLGDSLAEGVLDPPVDGYRPVPWPDRVAEALGRARPSLDHRNFGVRGLRARQVREGQLADALSWRPDLATLVCGGNDLLVPGMDRAAVEADIDAMVGGLRGAGATVFVFGLMNITAATDKMDLLRPRLMGLNASVRKVAARHGAVFVDLWKHPAADQRDLYSGDLMHMSARGHAHIATAAITALSGQMLSGQMT
jgi:lysophospholipase L1-like esterase